MTSRSSRCRAVLMVYSPRVQSMPHLHPATGRRAGPAAGEALGQRTTIPWLQLGGLDAAVLLPALVGVVRGDGSFVAEAQGGDPAAVDAFGDQVVATSLRAI